MSQGSCCYILLSTFYVVSLKDTNYTVLQIYNRVLQLCNGVLQRTLLII